MVPQERKVPEMYPGYGVVFQMVLFRVRFPCKSNTLLNMCYVQEVTVVVDLDMGSAETHT